MDTRNAISDLESISVKSEIFKLDMYDRAKIDNVVRWLKEIDKAFFEKQKLFGG